jgi:amino acid adenylation domain-containing protein
MKGIRLTMNKSPNFGGKWVRDLNSASLCGLFRACAQEHSDAIALECGDATLSYAQLDAASDGVAAQLLARGINTGDLVGLKATRRLETMVALLGIIKAGAGYVPLSASNPPAQQRQIAQSAKLRLIIGDVDGLSDSDAQTLCLDDISLAAPGDEAVVPDPVLDDTAVAYVMFTSGSTGVPKGVVIPHRGVIRLVQGQNFMSLGPKERILQNSPIAFDAATLEIWGALLNGGVLVIPPEGQISLRALGEIIAQKRITSMWMTAGLFGVMADERPADFAPLKQLLTGGDVVSPVKVARVKEHCPKLTVINGYGPTENTTFTCCHKISKTDLKSGKPLPIGKAITGTQVHIVDEQLNPVADGQEGELCASGAGLALGYLGDKALSAKAFVPAPWDENVTLYRTGDLAVRAKSGVVRFLGRMDSQVKIRGFRIELDAIDTVMERFDGISQACAIAKGAETSTDKTLMGFYVAEDALDEAALAAHLAENLPDYACPSQLVALDALPLNANGKVDRKALAAYKVTAKQAISKKVKSNDTKSLSSYIEAQLEDILSRTGLDKDTNFFDLGASSLHMSQLHARLESYLDRPFPITDFFLHASISAIAAHLQEDGSRTAAQVSTSKRADSDDDLIAIVGMAGRFPGAASVAEFWDGLVSGREMISHFSQEELDINPALDDVGAPYVAARGMMDGSDMFDARHFGIPPREAERMDPQHRIMLEVAQTALEDAGHDPDRFDGKIGLFCGTSQNSYLLNNLLSPAGASRAFAAGYPVKDFNTLFGNDKDFVATRVAYKLNLRGPAATVQCACSTSLVAVAQACESLRRGTSDMAMAGGVSITYPAKRPYLYTPDGMASSDGHCRTFDADATGTVFGDGAGLVVLRRLKDAVEDGDEIVAVIKGYSINNDGSDKIGYAAPSIKAQAEVIREAHAAAGVEPRSIGYIEAHGTGTPLGDPIEFAALTEAFGPGDTGYCAIGTAKTNVGHLDIAAGVTGLMKAAMTLKTKTIPPLLHYKAPNPNIDFDSSAFYPVKDLTDWAAPGDAPRRAGVSAFGVGGTNIHMVLEEGPAVDAAALPEVSGPQVYPLSASSGEALQAAAQNLGAWAQANGDVAPAALIERLRNGRRVYDSRAVIVADGMADLAQKAAAFTGKGMAADRRDKLAFLFPGQGAQHVGMARDLYEKETVFREALDLCATLLEPELGLNLLSIIHAPEDQREAMTERLKDTSLAQPAIFAIGYALAKQWAHWGIHPDAMLGHSIGEFAAATIAGVMDLRDALSLIALRGRLMSGLPGGVMMSVRASETEIAPFLGDGMDLAAVNGAKLCVIAGPDAAADALGPKLEAAGFAISRLHTSHAFHSHMMDDAVAPFREAVAKLKLRGPDIPILSTVTGDWMTEIEATDPDYWAGHMRAPVRFYDAISNFWDQGTHMFLETGPGRTLATLAGQNPDRKAAQPALASLPHAQADDANSHHAMLESFGNLWANGYPVDWSYLTPGSNDWPRLAPAAKLPSYPFQRKRHWVEPVDVDASAASHSAETGGEDTVVSAPAPISAIDALKNMFADLSGLEPEEMDAGATFLELGFDSLLLTQATKELTDQFGVSVALRALIDKYPSLDALAAHIEAEGNLAGVAPADISGPGDDTRIKPQDDDGTDGSDLGKSAVPIGNDTSSASDEMTPAQRAHIDDLVARYTAKTRKSKELTAHYRPYHADPRTASGFNRAWKELVYQIVTTRSKGSRLLDVDGNEYIDILNGFGPGFLGHGADMVVEAVHNQLDEGFEVGPQSLAAMEAAQLFCEVTGNDRASFVCTGSEAVYAAMRLARTCTGRDRIVMFARDYHGNFDEVLVRPVNSKAGPKTMPLAPGIPRDAVKNVVVLPYGTPEAMEYIRAHAHELAAVMVEPVQSRRPEFRPEEFIREVRRVTRKAGALFIFDEVVTGFRFGPRGAQDYYGVDADLVTYGKVVGGGMPVGVVSGKAQYMDTFDGGQWQYGDDSFPDAPVTFFAGTFVRHPLAMAALKSMLTFFKSQPDFFWKTVNAKGDALAGTLDRWFAENDMPFAMPNCGSLMYLRTDEDQKYGGLLGANIRARGVFFLEGFPSYMTAAHDDEDIDYVIEAVKDSALSMRRDGLLVGRESRAYESIGTMAPPARLSLPDGAARIATAMAAPLKPVEVPTTESQREIWTAMQLLPELVAGYNECATLRLSGEIDAPKMIEASKRAAARHDALRSVVSDDGTVMRVMPTAEFAVREVDIAHLSGQAQEDARRAVLDEEVTVPFDMNTAPLARAVLIKLGAEKWDLVLTAHHIIFDGWSISILAHDVGTIYTGLCKGEITELPRADSMIDYVQAEQAWLMSDEAKAAEDYWTGQFADLPPVFDLPTDRPRKALREVAATRYDAQMPGDVIEGLKGVAAKKGSTMVVTLLTAFKLYLARVAGNRDITVALPAAGQAARNMEWLVGHCINLMPLRTKIKSDEGFADLMGRVRTTMLDGYDHQFLTYGTLVRLLKVERDTSRNEITPVMFNIDTGMDMSGIPFDGAAMEFESNPRRFENFEIFLNLTETGGEMVAEWMYNTGIFDESTIEGHQNGLIAMLRKIIENPDIPVGDLLNLSWEDAIALSRSQKQREEDFDAQPMHQLIARQAAVQGDKIAVEMADGSDALSYAQLDALSNKLAHLMIARGVQKGSLVGVCLDRKPITMAVLLGVMKAGGAYVPLDPDLPTERLEIILEDSAAPLVVVNDATIERVGSGTQPRLNLNEIDDALDAASDAMPQIAMDMDDLAYVIFTSGTTGRPKGVQIRHEGFVNLITSMSRAPGFGADDRILAITTISFDLCIPELWGALMTGGTMVFADTNVARDPSLLADALERCAITFTQATPSSWRMLLDSGWAGAPDLKAVIGGEAVPTDVAHALAGKIKSLSNFYGPTETTVWSTTTPISPDRPVTIGQPMANTDVFVLDESLNPMPVGVDGALYIGGAGLARGYHNRPDLTAEAFIDHPHIAGERLYATGDLARWKADGEERYTLICLGRADDQIKLRGYRIEPGDVEAPLVSLEAIHESAVVKRTESAGDERLVAFITPARDGDTIDTAPLSTHLRGVLPAYMVPSRFVQINALPLTPNKKIDRKKLMSMDLPQEVLANGAVRSDASSAVEQRLHKIWVKILKTRDIGVDDNFFELGGHSMLAVKLFNQIEEHFGLKLPISTLFAHSTIRRLAAKIETESPMGGITGGHKGPPEDAPWDTTVVMAEGPDANAKQPLFIAGGVGGNVNNLREFAQILGQERPVIGLQTRGILGHKMHDSIEAMAVDHLQYIRQHQPKGPYFIAGYSGGAAVAFEMARQLEGRGEKVAYVGILDALAPGFHPPVEVTKMDRLATELRILREKGLDNFWSRLKPKLRETPVINTLLRKTGQMSDDYADLSKLSAHWRVVADKYQGGSYEGDVWLYINQPSSLRDVKYHEADDTYGWRHLVQGALDVTRLEYDHLDMLEGEAVTEVCKAVGMGLKQAQ